MARIDWHLQGLDVTSCSCDWGCPCQFMSLPTRGFCHAAVGFSVAKGHFGKTNLDGLSFGGLFAWPKAIHEGNGEAQPIVDVRATDEQRDAILKIMSGEETEPGATIFNVFAATYSKVHTPMFKPHHRRSGSHRSHGPIRRRGHRRVAYRADQESADWLDHACEGLASGRVRVGGGGARKQQGPHDDRPRRSRSPGRGGTVTSRG